MNPLAVAATAAGVAGAVSEILGADQPSMTLGPVTFTGLELPAHMEWGGRLLGGSQRAPDGRIVANTLGVHCLDPHWHGIFEGPTASARAKTLYALMRAAQPLPLSWLDQTWVVLIREFAAADITGGFVRYRIRCEVIADPSQIDGPPAPPSLADQITSDISSALGFNVVDAAGDAMTALGTVQQAAGLAGALTNGSAAFTSLASAAGLAAGAVEGATMLAEAGLTALPGVVSGASAAVSWVGGAATQIGNLANAVAAQGFIGRTVANLTHAST